MTYVLSMDVLINNINKKKEWIYYDTWQTNDPWVDQPFGPSPYSVFILHYLDFFILMTCAKSMDALINNINKKRNECKKIKRKKNKRT